MTEPPRTLPLRCLVTGNPVGTDTEMVGAPCKCQTCNAQRTLDAQSQLLAEANAKIEGWKEVYNQADKSRDEALDRLSATLSLLAEAREALEPFATMANQVDEWQKGADPKVNFEFSADTLRNARAVLAKLKAATPPAEGDDG